MSTLEATIEELKTLPPSQQDEVSRLIHALHESVAAQKEAVLKKTFGCLSQAEANEWEAAVEECRKIDDEGW